MDGFLSALIAIGLAEIGDRTQLLAALLGARHPRAPAAVILGIAVGTVVNYGLCAWGGALLAQQLPPRPVSLMLGIGFLFVGAWCFWPDQLPGDAAPSAQLGAFLASALAFFAIEFGDKSQLATAALAARFDAPVQVAAGASLAVLAVTAPCVIFGERVLRAVPVRPLRYAAGAIFLLLGLWTALGALRLI